MTAPTAPTQTPPPRRRWYHRHAVVETNLRDGTQSIVSYHITAGAAVVQVAQMVATFQGNVLLGDWFEWRPLPAASPLVRAVEKAPTLADRYGVTYPRPDNHPAP